VAILKVFAWALLLAPALLVNGGSMTEAKGEFEIKMTPEPGEDGVAGVSRMVMEKQYHGALEATSKGIFLSAGDPKSGNAGYVAIERVTGTLNGREGSFALMQKGEMSNGSAPQLGVSVVPGSGTGDLSGIYGTMTIVAEGGQHRYALKYALAK
jgi:hypothetical protein